MINFNLTAESMPRCPPETKYSSLAKLEHPSSTIIYGVFTITSIVFAIIIAFKYNSVKVFNRKIRTQNISNTLWIIYYLCMFGRSACTTVRFAITGGTDLYRSFFLGSLVLEGLSAFALSLSLNHQRKYRSSAPPNPPQQTAASSAAAAAAASASGTRGNSATVMSETAPLLGGVRASFRRTVSISEIVFFLLFVIYLVFLYLAETIRRSDHQDERFVLLFLATFLAQRLPILGLVIVIVTHRNGNEGPTKQSKAFLMLAAILSVVNFLPMFIWGQIAKETTCLGTFFSLMDILSVIHFGSLIFFFMFLRSEYLRNMEECIWTTVSQIQDTFDFRRF